MHRCVEQLRRIMAPPTEGGDVVDWEQIRRRYGMEFPNDYRDFVAVYGGGLISDHLGISTPPVDGSPYGDLLRSLGKETPADRPFPYLPYPAKGGILLWASDGDGDDVYWLCRGEPDEWTTVVHKRQHDHDEDPWKEYDVGMAEFLLRLLGRGLQGALSAGSFPETMPSFESWRSMFGGLDVSWS